LAGTAEKGCTPHRLSPVTAVSYRKCYAIRVMGFPPLTVPSKGKLTGHQAAEGIRNATWPMLPP
jgi:hypothetical protein